MCFRMFVVRRMGSTDLFWYYYTYTLVSDEVEGSVIICMYVLSDCFHDRSVSYLSRRSGKKKEGG